MDEKIKQTTSGNPTIEEITIWLTDYISQILEVETKQIDIEIPFDRYGLDSSIIIGMVTNLEDWLGYDLDPTTLYYYPTIEALAKHLGKT